MNPDEKVQFYLGGVDAVLIFATPDDEVQNADGNYMQVRPNVIDEYSRAKSDPTKAHKIIFMKERKVRLNSNINPAYISFEVEKIDDSLQALAQLLRELKSMGLLTVVGRDMQSNLEFSTDKKTYSRIESIIISGRVNPVIDSPISLQLFSPSKLESFQLPQIQNDGTFSSRFVLRSDAVLGTYTIQATYLGKSHDARIEVTT
jgi:hypothetical protein